MAIISHYDLSAIQWLLLALSGLMIGMAKTGVPGVSLIVVPTLAYIFGGKQSTGVLLPILIMADLFAVSYYRRHAEWRYLFKILPWALMGIGLALWVGNLVNDSQFKEIMAVLVFLCIGLMIWNDRSKGKSDYPDTLWFAASMGVLGGFATMIGNVAGPIFAIYLLAMHLPKNAYIGTGAWFFLILNVCKFPLHFFVWETIHLDSLILDVMTLPAIAIGAFLGIWMVKLIPEKIYRMAVIVVTTASAFLLLI